MWIRWWAVNLLNPRLFGLAAAASVTLKSINGSVLLIDPHSIRQLQFCTSRKLMGPWTVLKWCRCDSHPNACLPPGLQQTQSDQSKTSPLQATLLVTETSQCVHTCMKGRQYFCTFCCSLLLPFVRRLLGAIAAATAHCYWCQSSMLPGVVQQLLKF